MKRKARTQEEPEPPPFEWTEELEKELARLHRDEHLTQKQLAVHLGVSEGRVKSKIATMRKAGKLPATPSREASK